MKARQGNRKKYEEAFMSLCKLRHTKLQAARDLFLIDHLLEGEEAIMQQQKPFSELFTLGRNRRALTASVITMFLQQFCGVNVTVRISQSFLSIMGTNTSRPITLAQFSSSTQTTIRALPSSSPWDLVLSTSSLHFLPSGRLTPSVVATSFSPPSPSWPSFNSPWSPPSPYLPPLEPNLSSQSSECTSLASPIHLVKAPFPSSTAQKACPYTTATSAWESSRR